MSNSPFHSVRQSYTNTHTHDTHTKTETHTTTTNTAHRRKTFSTGEVKSLFLLLEKKWSQGAEAKILHQRHANLWLGWYAKTRITFSMEATTAVIRPLHVENGWRVKIGKTHVWGEWLASSICPLLPPSFPPQKNTSHCQKEFDFLPLLQTPLPKTSSHG